MSSFDALARRRSDRPLADRTISTFYDAMVAATQLELDHGFAHVAVVLDARHQVIDLTPYRDRATHTIATAVEWAWCVLMNRPRAARVLLLSVGIGDEPPTDEDAALYVRVCDAFADEGIEVLDWIRAGTTSLTSMAYALHPDRAWLNDAPRDRAEVLAALQAGGQDPSSPRHGAP